MKKDNLPPVWHAEPHTIAKHRILQQYLKAWMPILARQSAKIGNRTRQILFADVFAGPGRYAGGEDGSPIIALRTALGCKPFPATIQFLFVELDSERCNYLLYNVDDLSSELAEREDIQYQTIEGSATDELKKLFADADSNNVTFGPALVFLDQFGYGSVPMSLVRKIMSYAQCEVFSYLDAKGLGRFIADDTKWNSISEAFGDDSWQSVLSEPLHRRDNALVRLYENNLRKLAGVEHVLYFSMHGEDDRLLYWLFFCTNSVKGLTEMKKAMISVDDSGRMRFSDKTDPNQLSLVTGFTSENLASVLLQKLMHSSMTVGEIESFVLTQTPCVIFKEVLASLERAGKIRVMGAPGNRRKGSFTDDGWRIEFTEEPQGNLFP